MRFRTFCDLAQSKGVSVVFLITPLNAYYDPGPPEVLPEPAVETYLEAIRLARERQPENAEKVLRSLVGQYPDVAYFWYILGEISYALKKPGAANEAYREAYAKSTRRRQLEEYQSLALAVAGDFGLQVVDTRERFAQTWFHGTNVTDLFFDYCHLTPRGHLLIAEKLSAALDNEEA